MLNLSLLTVALKVGENYFTGQQQKKTAQAEQTEHLPCTAPQPCPTVTACIRITCMPHSSPTEVPRVILLQVKQYRRCNVRNIAPRDTLTSFNLGKYIM